MSKPRVYFRCDANSEIGMGHLIRSSALADVLNTTFDIHFMFRNTTSEIAGKYLNMKYNFIFIPAAENETEFLKHTLNTSYKNILVLDGYQFDSAYQEKCKTLNCKTVYIDDLVSFNYTCDLLINQSDLVKESDYITTGPVKFCLGPQYALLRQAFLKAANTPRRIKSIRHVFISFGGSDYHNITYNILKALNSCSNLEGIHVLSGPVNEHVEKWKSEFTNVKKIHFHFNLESQQVCNIMQQCQLALCPSSTLSLELCAVGIILITGTTADNQNGYYESLTRRKAAIGVGKWQDLPEAVLIAKIKEALTLDEEKINESIKNQKNYIDGKSGERLVSVFTELVSEIQTNQ